MTHPEVLEGTWEELSAHAERFKGRKLRLTVLLEGAEATGDFLTEQKLREVAARLFAEADNLKREPGTLSIDSHKKTFGEIIIDKYQKMGLKL